MIKKKVFNQCVLPVLPYGAETLTLTGKVIYEIKLPQNLMEESIYPSRDRVSNQIVTRKTGVTDTVKRISTLEWIWSEFVVKGGLGKIL